MADGSIAIAITVDGKEVDVASKSLDGLGKQSQTTTRGIKDMVVSFGLVKVASAAFNVLKSSISAATDRFDEFQKFPKVMSALGFSADESKSSIDKLSNGIEGLPTRLNDVVSQTQQLTAITGDLSKSTDTVLALNNAFLASGSSAEDASRGMIQYNQMLSKGTVDMMSWRSLQETMPLGLQKTAEAMGFVGKTAQHDLYKALQSGNVTFDDFNTQLIKLGTGTGQLAVLAKTNSEGISTSFTNLKNAAVKGLANVLDSLNEVSKESTGNSIAKNLDGLKVAINGAFSLMSSAIKASTPLIKTVVTVLGTLVNISKEMIPQLSGLAAGFIAWRASLAITSALSKANDLITAGQASRSLLATVIQKMTAFQTANNVAIQANVAAETARTGILTLSSGRMAVLTATTTAGTLATTAMATAVGLLQGAIALLTGPIGWVIAGVTALVGIFMIHSKRQKEAKEAAEKETKAYHELNDSIKSNRVEREKSIKSVENESAINDNLINSLSELYGKEKVSAADKKNMADIVGQLNEKYSDLNLVYSEETGYLNQSIDLIRQKTEAYEAQAKVTAYNDAINANLKEQIQLETQSKVLKENIAALEKEKSDASYGQLTGINAKIKEQQATLSETHEQEKNNTNEFRILKQDRITAINSEVEANNAANAAIQLSNETATLSYDMLSKTQKEAMDGMRTEYQSLADKATDAYNVINTQSEISVAKMTANMQANQVAIAEWATNIDVLAKRGLNEGLLNKLREAGPESAAQVKALVTATDTEFQNFNTTVGNAGTTAKDAFKTAFDTAGKGISESVVNMATGAKTTLSEQMASVNFQEYGQNIPNGVAGGIDSGSENAKMAADRVAGKVKEGFQLPLGITGSTSEVFDNAGKAIVQGAASGIDNNAEKATTASGKVAQDTIAKFDPMEGQAQTAGENVSSGLALGIDGNSGVALTAAQRLADQVSKKMREALEIHSPSRVMRDKVGRFIPEGLAVGIDKYANKAYQSIGRLSDGLLRPIVPEFAAGGYDIGSIGSFGNITNNYIQQSQNSERPINLYLDKKMFGVARNNDDISRIMQEMADETIRESRGGFGYT